MADVEHHFCVCSRPPSSPHTHHPSTSKVTILLTSGTAGSVGSLGVPQDRMGLLLLLTSALLSSCKTSDLPSSPAGSRWTLWMWLKDVSLTWCFYFLILLQDFHPGSVVKAQRGKYNARDITLAHMQTDRRFFFSETVAVGGES